MSKVNNVPEIYRNLKYTDRNDILVKERVKIFTQLFVTENSYSRIVFHFTEPLDDESGRGFPSEGIEIISGDEMENESSDGKYIEIQILKRFK